LVTGKVNKKHPPLGNCTGTFIRIGKLAGVNVSVTPSRVINTLFIAGCMLAVWVTESKLCIIPGIEVWRSFSEMPPVPIKEIKV
jgi:hypothetical protein